MTRFRFRRKKEVNKNLYEILAQKPMKSMTQEDMNLVQELARTEQGGMEFLRDLEFIEENRNDFSSYNTYDPSSNLPEVEVSIGSNLKSYIIAAFAILVTAGAIYAVFFHDSSANNLQYQFAMLPDGSQIQLAPDASYQINEETFMSSREITLNGNAFFDVVHNETLPFVVKFGETKISVLGTSFYIFQDEEIISVRDGKVKVESGADSKILVEGDAVEYSDNVLVETVYKGSKVSLFNREYKNASLNKVLQDLADDIGVNLKLHAEIQACVYNGVFENATALEVLEEMSLLYGIEYRVLLATLHIDSANCQ